MFMPSGVAAAERLSAEANPKTVVGASFDFPIVTGQTTCEVRGGTPPYTYAWSVSSNPSSATVAVLFPSAATTNFQCNAGPSPGTSAFVQFQCLVTDVNGFEATTICDAEFERLL